MVDAYIYNYYALVVKLQMEIEMNNSSRINTIFILSLALSACGGGATGDSKDTSQPENITSSISSGSELPGKGGGNGGTSEPGNGGSTGNGGTSGNAGNGNTTPSGGSKNAPYKLASYSLYETEAKRKLIGKSTFTYKNNNLISSTSYFGEKSYLSNKSQYQYNANNQMIKYSTTRYDSDGSILNTFEETYSYSNTKLVSGKSKNSEFKILNWNNNKATKIEYLTTGYPTRTVERTISNNRVMEKKEGNRIITYTYGSANVLNPLVGTNNPLLYLQDKNLKGYSILPTKVVYKDDSEGFEFRYDFDVKETNNKGFPTALLKTETYNSKRATNEVETYYYTFKYSQ